MEGWLAGTSSDAAYLLIPGPLTPAGFIGEVVSQKYADAGSKWGTSDRLAPPARKPRQLGCYGIVRRRHPTLPAVDPPELVLQGTRKQCSLPAARVWLCPELIADPL